MAVIKQGILGGFSGKIANVVGSSWKGIAVMKARPLSVANPKTAAQVAQRSKFSYAVAFAITILSEVIKPLWDRFASQMSGYNDFIQSNIDLFTGASPTPAADLIISKGKMDSTSIATAVYDMSGQELTVTWVDDSGEGYKLAEDVPFVVVVDSTIDEFAGMNGTGIGIRSDELFNDVSEAFDFLAVGHTAHIYLAFRRADGTVVSNTAHKSLTIQA